MAMLAAPRRKQKVINLRAKNSEWSKDSNKFGQKMLEKMGWSSGKGLGAKENGIVEHVVAKYKNDDKGLGFEDKNDQWTKHEDDFNALLANLSNGDKNEVQLHSGESLEVKSKKSKARVHYHKFTRGKDLSRYSEKDLANIFGKKSLKNKKTAPEFFNEDIKTTEQVFTEKGSMEDYFKSKLAAFKNKAPIPNFQTIDDEEEYAFQGFSNGGDNKSSNADDDTATHGFQGFSCYSQFDSQEDKTQDSNDHVKENKDKKKKRKKSKVISEEIDQLAIQCDIQENGQDEEPKVKRKESKNKNKSKSDEQNSTDEAKQKVVEETILKKRKKSSKNAKIIETEVPVEQTVTEDHVPKKKKKRKKNSD